MVGIKVQDSNWWCVWEMEGDCTCLGIGGRKGEWGGIGCDGGVDDYGDAVVGGVGVGVNEGGWVGEESGVGRLVDFLETEYVDR